MVNYSKRLIIVRGLGEFSLIFVGKMCVFVSRPMKIVTFLGKNGDLPKRVVDFLLERDTFRNKIMEIVEDFDETVTATTANPGNRRGFCVRSPKPVKSFFLFFFFFHFFIFVFFSFFNFSFSFPFLFSFFLFPFFIFCFFQEKCFFFSLPAFVLGINKRCFLRRRCSMEMWCPDDIGRDSWDWVGPPAWERACFNPPEWGGGSSPVKTEPPQIVLLCVVGRSARVCPHHRRMQRQSGGCGSDRIATAICFSVSHAPSKGGRTPRSKTPGVLATSSPRQPATVGHSTFCTTKGHPDRHEDDERRPQDPESTATWERSEFLPDATVDNKELVSTVEPRALNTEKIPEAIPRKNSTSCDEYRTSECRVRGDRRNNVHFPSANSA